MIRITFTNCKFGAVPIEGQDGKSGFVVRLVDEKTEMVVDTPFFGDSKIAFAEQIIDALSDEERRKLVPLVSGGIILPG